MNAVNLWKPHKLQSRTQFTDLNYVPLSYPFVERLIGTLRREY